MQEQDPKFLQSNEIEYLITSSEDEKTIYLDDSDGDFGYFDCIKHEIDIRPKPLIIEPKKLKKSPHPKYKKRIRSVENLFEKAMKNAKVRLIDLESNDPFDKRYGDKELVKYMKRINQLEKKKLNPIQINNMITRLNSRK